MAFEHVRIGEVLALRRREVAIDPMEDYRLIGIYSFGKGIFHRDPKIGAELGEYRFFAIEPGDLVLSNIQAWEGAISYATDADAGTVGTHRFLTYVPIAGRIDTNWARWFLLSETGMALIRGAAPGSTMRNRTLSIDRFEALEIPLPSMAEQHRVARKLDRTQACVMNVAQRSIRVTNLITALDASIAARPDLSGLVKKDLGWRRTRLGSVMHLTSDSVAIEPDGSYPNLGIYSFGRGLFEKSNIDGGRTSAKVLNRVHAGQFIYSRLFAFEGAYGYVSPAFDEYCVSNEFPTFDPDPMLLDAQWLASYLRSPDRWAELAGSSKGLGVRRQRVPVEAILAYEVWLPPIEQQRAMVLTAGSLDAARQMRVRADQLAKALVPAALNRAFAEWAQGSAPNGHRRR